jgi:hypothetical protein
VCAAFGSPRSAVARGTRSRVRPPHVGDRNYLDSGNIVPEITTTITHLSEVLGDARYESLARHGRTMTDAAMANYAFEQIDLARAQLNSPKAPT